MSSPPNDSLATAKLCARILQENKVRDVQVVDVGDALQITDYFILGTGLNARHLRAASSELFKGLRSAGLERRTIEGHHDERWVLVDFRDIVVHLFSPEAREYYDLESLWGECPRIAWQTGDPQAGGPGPAAGKAVAGEIEAQGRLRRSS